jgi:hypothetical protein
MAKSDAAVNSVIEGLDERLDLIPSNVIQFPYPLPAGAHRTNDAVVWGDIDDAILDRKIEVAVAGSIESPKWANVSSDFLTFLRKVTKHAERKSKDGLSFTQGKLSGTRRIQNAVESLDLMVIDLDNGQDGAELREGIRKLGLFAIIATSHNHMSAESEVKRDRIVDMIPADEDREPTLSDACAFLRDIKKYRPHVLDGAELIDPKRKAKGGVMMVVRHAPLQKMRVILLLKESFVIADRMTGRKKTRDVITEWQAKYAHVCGLIGAFYDPSCLDLSRGFYFPSHKPGKTDWRIDVLPGVMLNLDTIAVTDVTDPFATASKAMGGGDPDDGKDSVGKRFMKLYDNRFELETFLLTKDPDGDVEQRAAGGRTHACPFESDHTARDDGQPDKGFYCVNPADSVTGKAVAHCSHASCKSLERDRIDFVKAILDREGMTWADLGEWVPALVGVPDFDPALFGAAVEVETLPAFADYGAAKKAVEQITPEDSTTAGRVARQIGISPLGESEKAGLKLLWSKRSGLGAATFKAEAKAAQKQQPMPSLQARDGGDNTPSWAGDLTVADGGFHTVRWQADNTGVTHPFPDKFVCSVFEPVASVISPDGSQHGLRIKHAGREVTIAIKAIHDDKQSLAVMLHSEYGLECGTTRLAHDALAELMRCALHKADMPTLIEVAVPGWHCDGKVFVCANGAVVGAPVDESAVRLADGSGYPERAPDGVGDAQLENELYARVWQTPGADLWRFGDLLGLASACLGVVGCRSGGAVFDGTTRHGKTTTQRLQVGRAGCPDPQKATGGLVPAGASPEGVEIPLRNATGNPFALDESKLMRDSADVSRLLYGIAQGTGKPRMKRSADGNRETIKWHTISSLSTEKPVSVMVKKAGKSFDGGVVARFPSISVTGLLENTPDLGKLARDVERVLGGNYGHTFRLFVEKALMRVDRQRAYIEWRGLVERLANHGGDHLKAPAEFFAVCWWAGIQAARVGLTIGMTETTVEKTIAAAWAEFVGREESAALIGGAVEIEALQQYIAMNMDITVGCVTTGRPLENGYKGWTAYYDHTHYYIPSTRMDEVCGDAGNRQAVVKALQARGALVVGEGSGDLTWTSLPNVGKVRHYRLIRAKLGATEEDLEGVTNPFRV